MVESSSDAAIHVTADVEGFISVDPDDAFAPAQSPRCLSAVIESGPSPALVVAGGPPGRSAYEVWRLLPGNENGSEEEFFESLRGNQGAPGPDVGLYLGRAATPINGHRAVWSSPGGLAHTNCTDLHVVGSLLGVSLNAASEGEIVSVRLFGEISDPSFSWVVPGPIYCRHDGILSQEPSTAGVVLEVGFATAVDRMFVRVRDPDYLM